MTRRTTARYGWKPDLPDPRDKLWHEHHGVTDTAGLPAKVDLSANMPPIWNQGKLGSCTGHGIARVLAYEALRQGETLPGLSNDNAGFSRLFIYYNERAIEGSVDQDSGAQIRDGIKVVASQGAPPETDWPYSDANPGPFQTKPSATAYKDALQHEAIQYHRVIPGGGSMLSALATGMPIVFGFTVTSQFEDGSWNPATEVLSVPSADQRVIGGHCVVLTGYDWSCQQFPLPYFQCDNSWGVNWGRSGRFLMDARYFQSQLNLASDLWVISRVE